MKAYINGKHSHALLSQNARLMKLDSNEATISPSPRVAAALASFIQEGPLNWYPDVDSTELIQKLAFYTGCPESFIQTFNGSDNALETICRTFIEPGHEVVLCMPTYDHFRVYAESCDARLVPVYGKNPFVTKAAQLIKAATDQTKLLYIVNPNNPTGLLYSATQIEQILKAVPHVLVIVDEAYFEFCGVTMAPLATQYPNLIVTRSFSKAFGLAGLRCGYVLTHPDNLKAINKIRIGKNVNSLAQVAASAALDDREYMEHYVSEVRLARKWLTGRIRKMGLKTVETPANYILVEVAHPLPVLDHLEAQQIFIRDRSFFPQLEGFIRISIGHQLLMERFWKVFEKIPPQFLFDRQRSSTPVEMVVK